MRTIDIHAHLTPQCFWRATENSGNWHTIRREKDALATSRATNDEISEMVRGWPKRFAGLGTVPMQDVKAATTELERCMTQLGLKGVEINDHVNGRTLEESEFRPFWKAAEQMGAV